MAGLTNTYGFETDGSETLKVATDGDTDALHHLRRRALRRTAVAGAMLKIGAAVSFLSAITADTPNMAFLFIQYTIIAFALLSYTAGVICMIYATSESRRRWSTMLSSMIICGVATMRICAWYIGTLGALRAIGAFMLGTTLAVIGYLVLRRGL